MMNGGKIMDKSLVTIEYKTAGGSKISVEVSTSVKEVLEETDRKIRSQRRQDRRRIDFTPLTDEFLEISLLAATEDTADLVMKRESYRRLYAAINELPEMQRRRLLLHFTDDMTYRKIADIEGVNQSAIGRSIKRALNQLHKYLAD